MNFPTRVLVTGAAGQVGRDLMDVLRGETPPGGDPSFQPDGRSVAPAEFEATGFSHETLDVTDRDAVVRTLRDVRPEVVVHLAAYTAVDRAEGDAEACFAVNEQGTLNMSLGAHEVGAHLITISTDYVFDGRKGEAYVEYDQAHPLNVYGASKLEGELRCASDDTIVRTSWVMGVRGTSVIHVIAERALGGDTVRFVDDQTGTVTLASDLARSLVTLARERPGGVWHVANQGATTWFDVAAYVGEILHRGEDFATPIFSSELAGAQVATRPERSDLNTHKFAAAWSALPAWREGVARLIADRSGREIA
ncbi:MAG TPA: dTDP-4-dehydrorhamnose reductase [Acidimicrobiales bacterium]|nr:dTDP-4-dehydrorhamnose reductase [Acidimicrobiales bacterium]